MTRTHKAISSLLVLSLSVVIPCACDNTHSSKPTPLRHTHDFGDSEATIVGSWMDYRNQSAPQFFILSRKCVVDMSVVSKARKRGHLQFSKLRKHDELLRKFLRVHAELAKSERAIEFSQQTVATSVSHVVVKESETRREFEIAVLRSAESGKRVGLLQISLPVVSADKKSALFYFSLSRGEQGGYAGVVLLKRQKIDEKWSVAAEDVLVRWS